MTNITFFLLNWPPFLINTSLLTNFSVTWILFIFPFWKREMLCNSVWWNIVGWFRIINIKIRSARWQHLLHSVFFLKSATSKCYRFLLILQQLPKCFVYKHLAMWTNLPLLLFALSLHMLPLLLLLHRVLVVIYKKWIYSCCYSCCYCS